MNNPLKAIADSFKSQNPLNREDGSLPYGYYNPQTEGKLTWICGEDAEGRITSVFSMDLGSHKEKKCQYLESIEDAQVIRDELVKNDWQKLELPDITFKFEDGSDRALTRKERRQLARNLKNMAKRSGFEK